MVKVFFSPVKSDVHRNVRTCYSVYVRMRACKKNNDLTYRPLALCLEDVETQNYGSKSASVAYWFDRMSVHGPNRRAKRSWLLAFLLWTVVGGNLSRVELRVFRSVIEGRTHIGELF